MTVAILYQTEYNKTITTTITFEKNTDKDGFSSLPDYKVKVTSKNISPKAKKYGIIEPTNKVGDLDAVESICRR